MNHDPYRRSGSPLPMVLAGAALVAAGWLLFDRLSTAPIHTNAEPRAIVARGDLLDLEQARIQIFEENAPSVVHITSRARSRRGGVTEGTGTGFVWDERGYIVTNYHVVQSIGSDIEVRFPNGRRYGAAVVGAEPAVDVAVVKLMQSPSGLRPIPLGSSEDLRVGQSVLAIGNPFGLDRTLTSGVISALDRVIDSVAGTPIQGVIQVDAAINPGNSGGPLLDSAGRLIGMNTAIYSPSGTSAGIGFAVPADTINRVTPRLIRGDRGTRPALGIRLAKYSLRLDSGRHPMIGEVVPGGGADDAGLVGYDGYRYGDVILAIDEAPVTSTEALLAILDQKELGDTVQVKVLRQKGDDFDRLTIPVVLKTENQRRE